MESDAESTISSVSSIDEFEDVVYTFTRHPITEEAKAEAENDPPSVRASNRPTLFMLSGQGAGAGVLPSSNRILRAEIKGLPLVDGDDSDDDGLSPIGPARKHFLHLHSMPLYQLRRSDAIKCKICSLTIAGKAYGCKDCSFYIHELCFGFPQRIRHVGHSAHTLELVPTRYAIKTDDFTCVACGFGTETPDQAPGGRQSPVFSVHYRCIPHQFALHLTCASAYTSAVIDDDGYNPVNLFTTFPLRNELGTLKCVRCRVEIRRDSWVFFNRNSTKIAHFTCVTDHLYGKDKYKNFILGVSNRLGEIQVDDAWMNKGDGLSGIHDPDHRQICHRHILQKWSRMSSAPVCQLCGNGINEDMYGCKACSYYFHQDCARIPLEIQHPAHSEHPLTLVLLPSDRKKTCRACGDSCFWFSYGCISCEFYININYGKCASYPQSLGINVSGNLKSFALMYSFPYEKEASAMKCNKCGNSICKDTHWMYYNKETDLKYHLKCAGEQAHLDREWKAALDRLVALQVD